MEAILAVILGFAIIIGSTYGGLLLAYFFSEVVPDYIKKTFKKTKC